MTNNKSTAPENPLFRGDIHNTELNACVGENGGPYDLWDYAQGFFAGAEAMVNYVSQGQTYAIDVLVYPVAFSYRHGIELYLKQLVNNLRLLSGTAEKIKRGHNLSYYWDLCRGEIEALDGLGFPNELLESMGKTINNFCEFDPTGQVFRYPEDIKGNQTISGFSLINLRILSDQMSKLGKDLSNAVDWTYIQLELKAEAENG